MITLERLFQNMAYGELSNIAIGNSTLGSISPADYGLMLSHVQLGLSALHQRFLVRTGRVNIQQYEAVEKYYLLYKYAKSNSASLETYKYILDSTSDIFCENVFKIEQVFDEYGVEYKINDSSVDFPISTPEYNSMYFPESTLDPIWTILYRTDYPTIELTNDFNPANVTLNIPTFLHEPLQCYVTGRIMTGQSHSIFEGVAEGDKYMARYEQLCQALEYQNLDIDVNETFDHIQANGWV